MSMTKSQTGGASVIAPRTSAIAGLLTPHRIQATTVQALTVLLFIVAALTMNGFLSAANISSILYSASSIGIAAIGLAAVTLSGNLFALSLGSTAAFAAILFIGALPMGVGAAMAIAVGMGLLAGVLQGIVVGLLRCNAIISTIAASSIIAGLATAISGGRTLLSDGSASLLGSGQIVPGIPVQSLLFLAAIVIGEVLLLRTRFGAEIRLRGTNAAAAELAGLRTERTVVLSFAVCGACGALAGVLIAAQSGTGNLRVGADLDFSAIAAMLIGGIAINGGRGRITDVAVGTLFLALLSNVLLINNFAYEIQLMIKGLAVIAAVTAGALLGRRRK